MISLLIKSYLSILLSVALGALLLIVGGIFIIVRSFSKQPAAPKMVNVSVPKSASPAPAPILQAIENPQSELSAIAGDDLIATQLDLARAYIEIENQTAAVKLLKMVAKQGSQSQQEEAKRLITQITDVQFVERARKNSRK